jgi:thiamine transport system permease protein
LNSIFEPWILDALRYTFQQAFFSAVGSVFIGLILTCVLSRGQSYRALMGICMVPFALPSVLISFGWVLSYGNSGWINHILQSLFGLQLKFLYRESTLVIAHLFVYFGFCWSNLDATYQRMPTHFFQSAASLRLTPWQKFCAVEIHWLKWPVFQSFILVFMGCLSSFSLALSLGAGSGSATTEVVVYQLIKFESNVPLALKVAGLQLPFSLMIASLLWLMPSEEQKPETQNRTSFSSNSLTKIILAMGTLFFVCVPLLGILIDFCVQFPKWSHFDPSFWISLKRSCFQSGVIALINAFLAPAIGFGLLRTHLMLKLQSTHQIKTPRQKASEQFPKDRRSQTVLIDFSSWFVMGLSPTLCAALIGYGLMYGNTPSAWSNPLLTLTLHTFFSWPLCCKILEKPMTGIFVSRANPIATLDLTQFQKIQSIEWPALQQPFLLCGALAFTFSLGESGIASLLSTSDWTPISVLLLELMGNYRFAEATLVSAIMLTWLGLVLTIYSVFGKGRT